MLSLGHFVVVNWSEQLAVMQVMELLFSFHLQGLCMCMCVCVSKPGWIWWCWGQWRGGGVGGREKKAWHEVIQPDDGRNEGNIMLEHSNKTCTGVSCFFKHLQHQFASSASNCDGGTFQWGNVVVFTTLWQMNKKDWSLFTRPSPNSNSIFHTWRASQIQILSVHNVYAPLYACSLKYGTCFTKPE